CTGDGTFNVMWYSSLTLGRAIEIANMKNVSISGSGLPTIRGGPNDINSGYAVDSASGTGIFSVAGSSTLRLSHLVLEAGSSLNGGAINMREDSSLFVFSCAFLSNNASNGGQTNMCARKYITR
ncbi:MAG: hypothetical protein ABJ059_05920, partial [Hyphomicrobiales bacterium]